MTHGIQPAERFDELLSRLVDEGLSPEALSDLCGLLRAQPRFMETLADHLILDSLLAEALGSGSMAELVDLVAEPHLDAPRGSAVSQHADSPMWGRLRRRTAWAAAAAVIAILAFYIGRENAVRADAATVVQAALLTHSGPVERVYTVHVQRETDSISGYTPPRDVRLMTQGDRFYVEMERGDRGWVWGRDAEGAIWLTLGPSRTLLIQKEELGAPLRYIGELYSLNLESLLRGALSRYRLEYASVEGPTYVIKATPRTNRAGGWRELLFEVDRETKGIRQLVVHRDSAEYGPATVTFTLVDARVPDESKYTPEGHLTAPYRVLTSHALPDERRALLLRRFGPSAENWIANKEESGNEMQL